jgi:phenazine biosynthesis protein phzE
MQSAEFNFNKPFAIIKRQDDPDVLVLEGDVVKLDKLTDIPRRYNKPKQGEIFDTLNFLPFSQIKERGYKVRDSGAKILCLKIKKQTRISVQKLYSILPDEKIVLNSKVKYDTAERQYADIIKKIIKDEIGNGEGANFVIPRTGTAKIKNMTTDIALSIFKNILQNEIGSYWSFIFYTGSQYFIGATPERHLTIEGNKVAMNPISGTFRKNIKNLKLAQFKRDFKRFLTDQKEINELFMVVDEELKMMAKFCSAGGEIKGPLLKEMSKLIHTEYLLEGRSNNGMINILRESMYAATVVGSPVESACRVIYKYEPKDRRYYASALALIGNNQQGQNILDSSIAIRTVEIDKAGKLLTRVGATLVRNSIPRDEIKETKSKIAAVLDNIINPPATKPQAILPKLKKDALFNKLLKKRNKELSKFWFCAQDKKNTATRALINKKITIIDNEDDFCFMIKHMLSRLGAEVQIIRYSDYDLNQDKSDITIIGPGTGNPNQLKDKKMKIVADITQQLLTSRKKFLAVCLGQQFLCKALGIKVVKKKNPFQGIAKVIDFFGRKERVGFYNTFVGKYEKNIKGVKIAYDIKTKEINALRGDNFSGFQFHAESILTQHGYAMLRDELTRLLNKK